MNREEYINHLEQGNGYCTCEGLPSLFERRRAAEALEKKCNLLKEKADLKHPKAEDKKKLGEYLRVAETLREKADDYHRKVSSEIERGRLRLFLHDEERFCRTCRISPEKARRLLEENKIITIHCSVCDKQIDMLR